MTPTYDLTDSQKNTMLDYLKAYPDADFLEKVELRKWMKEGNSPYSNGDGLVDDDGQLIDFIGAIRVWDRLFAEYSQNPQEFRKRYFSGRSVIYLSDLPKPARS